MKPRVLLAAVAVGVTSLAGCGGGSAGAQVESTRSDGGKLSGDDREAADFVRAKLEEHWAKGPDGWTTQFQKVNVFGQPLEGTPDVLFHQYREFKFEIDPDPVSESQRLNGADYRANVLFSGTPERFFQTVATFDGPAGWSQWRDSLPTLGLAVERRNGKWLISESDLFNDLRPDPSKVPSGN